MPHLCPEGLVTAPISGSGNSRKPTEETAPLHEAGVRLVAVAQSLLSDPSRSLAKSLITGLRDASPIALQYLLTALPKGLDGLVEVLPSSVTPRWPRRSPYRMHLLKHLATQRLTDLTIKQKSDLIWIAAREQRSDLVAKVFFAHQGTDLTDLKHACDRTGRETLVRLTHLLDVEHGPRIFDHIHTQPKLDRPLLYQDIDDTTWNTYDGRYLAGGRDRPLPGSLALREALDARSGGAPDVRRVFLTSRFAEHATVSAAKLTQMGYAAPVTIINYDSAGPMPDRTPDGSARRKAHNYKAHRRWFPEYTRAYFFGDDQGNRDPITARLLLNQQVVAGAILLNVPTLTGETLVRSRVGDFGVCPRTMLGAALAFYRWKLIDGDDLRIVAEGTLHDLKDLNLSGEARQVAYADHRTELDALNQELSHPVSWPFDSEGGFATS